MSQLPFGWDVETWTNDVAVEWWYHIEGEPMVRVTLEGVDKYEATYSDDSVIFYEGKQEDIFSEISERADSCLV